MMRLKLDTWSVFAFVAAIAPATAHAADLPSPITFEAFTAGPLGTLELSGGADAYGYALTGAGSDTNKGLLGTSTSVGVQFMNGLVELQKPDGLLRFTVQVGAVNSLTLGTKPGPPSIQTWSTGPVRTAYVTLAPTENFTISAGQIGSVEGFESGIDWENYNLFTTAIFFVENSQSVGVKATYKLGSLTGTIIFGDGFDTNVWNYLQLKADYTINDNNSTTLYGATNLGSTGLGARFYGSATTPYNQTTVASAGVANLVNSSMVGGYYTFTAGNLSLVPEVQYVWSSKNASVGLTDYSSHFGAALFANYKFGDSPFSLGGWAQYFSSNGSAFWFLNPGAQGFGMAIGPTWTPAWANKHLFVRGDAGVIHLTNVGAPGSIAFGSGGRERNQATFVLEVGALF
jgi:hypothetical protein